MHSDYVDNWDGLPESVQRALQPIIDTFDRAADMLFDRRLNLSFEAAVKELSVPGIVELTNGLRELRDLLLTHVTIGDAAAGELLFDGDHPLTAYDLPLYTPCVYLSQLGQHMEAQEVRVWKDTTAEEIVEIYLTMARYIRPDIETARVCIAALHDMVMIHLEARPLIQAAQEDVTYPNAARIATLATALLTHRR